MKFLSDLDAKTFLLEIKRFDKIEEATKNYIPTCEEMDSFIKARSPVVSSMKNYRKSSAQKANWRQNRGNMMKGIKAFHKSVEGKRFHRRMARFMASRITRDKVTEGFNSLIQKQEYLKGINSAKQHLFVELEFFHQIQEQVELEDLILNHALPLFNIIESKVINDRELSEDEFLFLIDITDRNSLLLEISDKTGREFAEIENLWNSISDAIEEQGLAKESNEFYPSLIERLKHEVSI